MSSVADKKAEGTSVPYVAFKTFKNFIGLLVENEVPTQIDKSVMHGMSGGTQSHLLSALKFLCLIDVAGKPTSNLSQLVHAYGSPEWPLVLRPLVTEAYADLIGDIDIGKASSTELDGCFQSLGLTSSSIDKAVRFYVSCCKDSGIAVSSFIEKRKPKATRSRRSNGGNKSSQTAKAPLRTPDIQDPTTHHIDYPIHFRNGKQGLIRVPADITEADCEMITLVVPLIKAYAGQS